MLAETKGGMWALFRWIRQGPSSLQSTGVVVRADGLYAGQKALLVASEEAWWPIWESTDEPRWERVNPPKATGGWKPRFQRPGAPAAHLGHQCREGCWP